jgi:hypothetical protein
MVMKDHLQYHKDQKSFEDRKSQSAWKSDIASKSGYWDSSQLVIPEKFYSPDLHTSDILILNDFNAALKSKASEIQNNKINLVQYLNLSSPKKYEIFQLKQVDASIELHLNYDLYAIGEPERSNFKLCNLEMNVPVEVKINGKLDHSLTSGRERTFKEHCYIFHLNGTTDNFELKREPFQEVIKQIPKPSKVIDLMKVLY